MSFSARAAARGRAAGPGRNFAGRIPALAVILLLQLVPGPGTAAMAGALALPRALPPGEVFPPPGQRGLNDITNIPTHEEVCPVCSFAVLVPEADKLMRRGANTGTGADGPAVPWRMDAATRDRDFCPYPGKYKLSYQADIVVCPSCGYAAPAGEFATAVPPEEADWVRRSLRPNMISTLRGLLGRREAEMADGAIAAFYNRQEEIPDAVRLEHNRVRLAATGAPWRDQEAAARLAAWAARRGVAAGPESVFLSRRAGNVLKTLEEAEGAPAPGSADEAGALRRLLTRTRAGKDRLNPPDQFAARLMLAGSLARLGAGGEAAEILATLHSELQERFLRPEQDPLWSATSARRARTARLNELELYRAESEREVAVRQGLLQRERECLALAAAAFSEAVRAGELSGRPDDALYGVYLTGETHRRLGDLPLAAEWFKHTQSFAPESAWAALAEEQLELVREAAAAGNVNLLTGLGLDADLFDILRGEFTP